MLNTAGIAGVIDALVVRPIKKAMKPVTLDIDHLLQGLMQEREGVADQRLRLLAPGTGGAGS